MIPDCISKFLMHKNYFSYISFNYIQLYQLFSSFFQASKEILVENATDIWWASKRLEINKTLSDYVGKNEKSKLIVKLQKVSFVFYSKIYQLVIVTIF